MVQTSMESKTKFAPQKSNQAVSSMIITGENMLDFRKLTADTAHGFTEEEVRGFNNYDKLFEIYLKQTKIGPWKAEDAKDENDKPISEFGLQNYEELGPELLLNVKSLDSYRYSGS